MMGFRSSKHLRLYEDMKKIGRKTMGYAQSKDLDFYERKKMKSFERSKDLKLYKDKKEKGRKIMGCHQIKSWIRIEKEEN